MFFENSSLSEKTKNTVKNSLVELECQSQSRNGRLEDGKMKPS